MVENEMNVYHSHNNKLQMNDSSLNNFPRNQNRKVIGIKVWKYQ